MAYTLSSDMHINQNISFLVKVAVLLVLLCCASCAPKKGYVTITGYAQGGTYAVKFNMDGVSLKPEEIRDSVEAILHRIDFSLSGYNKNSLLSRFNAGETVTPDSLFSDIYSHAYKFWEETDGLVDASCSSF